MFKDKVKFSSYFKIIFCFFKNKSMVALHLSMFVCPTDLFWLKFVSLAFSMFACGCGSLKIKKIISLYSSWDDISLFLEEHSTIHSVHKKSFKENMILLVVIQDRRRIVMSKDSLWQWAEHPIYFIYLLSLLVCQSCLHTNKYIYAYKGFEIFFYSGFFSFDLLF